MIYNGGCYCGEVRYQLDLSSPDEARTSVCHCKNCKKLFGSAFGITAKVPRKAFTFTSGKPKIHESDNGPGIMLHREFCETCGSGILEYGANAGDNTYIMYGTLDDPEALPPKGEFFCKSRSTWMPEIPGVFHKQEIKE
ncbi:hypothetical protein JAAARDRAFT_121493 [Jaapia argillacea MUCL 33604]|uniref:CENP-V/GFA domain-containing protein n=1 Tax=Jaapia argillacea MUCL 33604 TaxID=933084 RepID=A0A067Q8U2_9AGAM|nr:hypothetical protein JAAARDRAFT_121493 [Jaapia argillacea MUCL 33604]